MIRRDKNNTQEIRCVWRRWMRSLSWGFKKQLYKYKCGKSFSLSKFMRKSWFNVSQHQDRDILWAKSVNEVIESRKGCRDSVPGTAASVQVNVQTSQDGWTVKVYLNMGTSALWEDHEVGWRDEGQERKEENPCRFSKESIVELEEWVSIRVMNMLNWITTQE